MKIKTLPDLEKLKANFLTTGKLIEWLSKFPKDTLVYQMEMNTGTWQHVPYAGNIVTDYDTEFKNTLDRYEHFYQDKGTVEQKREETFRYVHDGEGVFILL